MIELKIDDVNYVAMLSVSGGRIGFCRGIKENHDRTPVLEVPCGKAMASVLFDTVMRGGDPPRSPAFPSANDVRAILTSLVIAYRAGQEVNNG